MLRRPGAGAPGLAGAGDGARRRPGSIELQTDALSDAELGYAFMVAGQIYGGRLPGTPRAVRELFLRMAKSIDATMTQREDRWREIWSELAWDEIESLESDGGSG